MQLMCYLEELNNKQVNKQINKIMAKRDMYYEENITRCKVGNSTSGGRSGRVL